VNLKINIVMLCILAYITFSRTREIISIPTSWGKHEQFQLTHDPGASFLPSLTVVGVLLALAHSLRDHRDKISKVKGSHIEVGPTLCTQNDDGNF
jgi:hypothetical protein